MRNEWNQLDFILETCPIHGYKIAQIPVRTNYVINRSLYSKIEQPLIFPIDRNIIHNTSNQTFINPKREKYYYSNNYNSYNNVQEEANQTRSYNSYNITGFKPDNEFTNNYSFYISGTSRLQPRVTINNISNQNTGQIIDNFNPQQRHNYIFPSYNDNNKNIKNNINNMNNGYIMKDTKSYNGRKMKKKKKIVHKYQYSDDPNIINTEPDEIIEENNNYNKSKYYYYTPNYYNDNDKESNLDIMNYYINRNINNSFKIIKDNNINERMVDGNNLYPKKRIRKKGYRNAENYVIYTENEINKPKINNNENKINKKIYNNYKEINSIYQSPKINNKNNSNLGDKNEKKGIDKINVKITNLNNHKFFISNNKIINTNRKISQKPNKINNYIIENVNKDIQIEKDLNNKKYIKNDYKKKYNNYNSNNVNRNQKNYSMQLIKDKKNDYLNKEIKGKYKNNKKEIEEINEGNKTTNDKDENVEQHIEKYYDSHGNFIGGKNVIVKKKYKDNGEKVIREVIKEEYKSNFNNLFKKFIPKKEEDGKYIQEEQEKYFPYQFNCEKLKKTDENNNINETDNNIKPNSYKNFEEQIKESKLEKNEEEENKNRIVTFGIKSDNLRFEIEDKDEKEADEQQIMINSEFEEEEENNIIKNNNTDKKEIIKSENISNKNDESNENNINDNKNVNKDNEFEDNNIDIIEKDNENK